jgi:hypothetical protein
MARMTKAQQADTLAAQEELREILSPGDVVGVIQRHVSRSGMLRHLSLYAGERNITHLAGRAMADPARDIHGHWVLKVGGCGMDMHFATVYNLARTLFPSTDSDGGYSLTHRTL